LASGARCNRSISADIALHLATSTKRKAKKNPGGLGRGNQINCGLSHFEDSKQRIHSDLPRGLLASHGGDSAPHVIEVIVVERLDA
jgi:hypothetical protein